MNSTQRDEETPKIQNVVATVNLNIEGPLPLDIIANKCNNTQYNKKRFPAVIMRKKNPKTTGLIFGTGKMIVIGAKSVEQAHDAARKLAKDIGKNIEQKIDLKKLNIQIRNIVASCKLPFGVDLEKLYDDDNHLKHSKKTDSFPGLIYTLQKAKSKLVALIFYSGKMVFTGAQNEEEIEEAYNSFKRMLKDFQKVQNRPTQ